MFVHVVLFWLNENAPPAAREQLLGDARELLGSVPGITKIEVGRPAMTPREVVDNSYHVGLLTIFTDQTAHDAYQTHPQHLKFIERNKAHWQRVRIYDFA